VCAATLLKLAGDRLATGAGRGVSGWNGDVLYQVMKSSTTCLKGIMHMVEDIVNDNVPDHARSLHTQSRLLASAKKADSDDARPLALPEPVLKLALLYVLEIARASLEAHFAPMQVAVCAPSGLEKALRVLTAALEAGGDEALSLLSDQENVLTI
jgi:hypothetical protein